MAGMIERNANFPLALKQRTGITDGKPIFGSPVPCLGMVFGLSQNDINRLGSIQDGKVFLVAPLESHPALPGFITYDGKDYEIKSLKIIRNLKGIVQGYRIVAVGGS